jgi:hypothetical protein
MSIKSGRCGQSLQHGMTRCWTLFRRYGWSVEYLKAPTVPSDEFVKADLILETDINIHDLSLRLEDWSVLIKAIEFLGLVALGLSCSNFGRGLLPLKYLLLDVSSLGVDQSKEARSICNKSLLKAPDVDSSADKPFIRPKMPMYMTRCTCVSKNDLPVGAVFNSAMSPLHSACFQTTLRPWLMLLRGSVV